MRLLRFAGESGPEFGVVEGGEVACLGPVDVASLAGGVAPTGRRVPLRSVTPLPPAGRAAKVIGVGMNYEPFVFQLGEARPAHPVLFHKTSSALTGAGSPIVIPPVTDQAVPEGELAVVVGRPGFGVAEREVDAHLLGYTCANDVSARDLEFRTSQWTSGKMLPTFCPLGPWLVTPDEFGDPGDAGLRTYVNGGLVQSGRTSEMIFSVRRLVSEISSLVRLEAGDVILTGTPSDLGEVPLFLRPGDVVAVEVDGVGRLENPVRQG